MEASLSIRNSGRPPGGGHRANRAPAELGAAAPRFRMRCADRALRGNSEAFL